MKYSFLFILMPFAFFSCSLKKQVNAVVETKEVKLNRFIVKENLTELIKDVLCISMSNSDYDSLQSERLKILEITKLRMARLKKTKYDVAFSTDTFSKNARLKLIGLNRDHYMVKNHFGFRFYYKEEDITHKNNFIRPRTRMGLTDCLANIVFKNFYNGLQIKYSAIPIEINGIKSPPYLVERFFDTYFLIENNKPDGPIFEYYTELAEEESDKKIEFNYLDTSSIGISIQDSIYKNNHKWFVDRVDHPKMMGLIAIGLLNHCHHHAISSNLHWYYNPITKMFEPTVRELQNYETDRFTAYSITNKEERHLFYHNYIASESQRTNRIIEPYIDLKYTSKQEFYKDLDLVIKQVMLQYQIAFVSDFRNQLISQFDDGTAKFIERKENNVKQCINYINRSFLTE